MENSMDFLRELKIELAYDPVIPLLAKYLEKKTQKHNLKDTCTPPFIAALFTTVRT